MIWLAALTLLAGSCAADGEVCVFVNGWETKPSFKNAEVLLLLSGKPQANARLTVIPADGKGWRFVDTIVVRAFGFAAECFSVEIRRAGKEC
jgi:hypothetical protein